MKKKDIIIGETYYATVSGKRVRVRIDRERTRDESYGLGNRGVSCGTYPRSYWQATNLTTGRAIEINSAARLTPWPWTATINSLLADRRASGRRRHHEIIMRTDAAGDRL